MLLTEQQKTKRNKTMEKAPIFTPEAKEENIVDQTVEQNTMGGEVVDTYGETQQEMTSEPEKIFVGKDSFAYSTKEKAWESWAS